MRSSGHPTRTQITSRLAVGLASGLLPALAVGQSAATAGRSGDGTVTTQLTTQPTTQPAAQSYWLRTTAELVNIRSRPDANSEIVARVPRDTVFQALGEQFGWHSILPPKGVYSYVAAAYVERQGEEDGVVSVKSGSLRVRVGSLVRELDPNRSEVQALLPASTPVRIVGVQDTWLKIVPPEGVRVHVADQFVTRISDDVAQRLRLASSQPAGVAASHPAQPTTRVAASRLSDQPDLSGAWGQRLAQVERDIQTEAARPVSEQAWSDAMARLAPIAAQRAEPAIARLAAAWIAELQQRTAEQEAVRAAEETLRRIAREQAQHDREMERIERSRRTSTRPAFDARGALRRSEAAAATAGSAKLNSAPTYLLQDPLTGKVEIYIETAPELKGDLAELIGRYVGVRGARRQDSTLGADVLRVTEIVVLERAGSTSSPSP